MDLVPDAVPEERLHLVGPFKVHDLARVGCGAARRGARWRGGLGRRNVGRVLRAAERGEFRVEELQGLIRDALADDAQRVRAAFYEVVVTVGREVAEEEREAGACRDGGGGGIFAPGRFGVGR